MFDYNLIFKDKAEADNIISQVVGDLHPSQFVRYDIGQIKSYEYNEGDIEAPPIETIINKAWHVNLRLRTDNKLVEKYQVFPETPLHEFS